MNLSTLNPSWFIISAGIGCYFAGVIGAFVAILNRVFRGADPFEDQESWRQIAIGFTIFFTSLGFAMAWPFWAFGDLKIE